MHEIVDIYPKGVRLKVNAATNLELLLVEFK